MGNTTRALVLGAGIQGVTAALALRSKGIRPMLVDKTPDCMLRASLRNEGKVHLGLVYAKDASFRTPQLMLRSALAFAPAIESLAGRPPDWAGMVSSPFVYVLGQGSMVSKAELIGFYDKLDACYQALRADGEVNYLGTAPPRLYAPLSKHSMLQWTSPTFAQDAFQTAELALDLPRFRAFLRDALNAHEDIETCYGHVVEDVERHAGGFRVSGKTTAGDTWTRDADIVVNCLWEERLAIDARMGLVAPRPWVYRLKYRVMAELPDGLQGLPSMTFVVGAYGDVVTYPEGPAYLSWYPACKRGWSDSLRIPEAWQSACDAMVPQADAASIAEQTLAGIEGVVPGIAHATPVQVDGGVIFSWGETDIDDPTSELHRRYEIGVAQHDGYFSIDTGKFTSAPYFARQLADRL